MSLKLNSLRIESLSNSLESKMRGCFITPILLILATLMSCDYLLDVEVEPVIEWHDVVGKTWYNKSSEAFILNTVTFTQDTIYHWIDSYSPVDQVQGNIVIEAGQVTSRQLRKGYVYNKGEAYVDGDGEVLYLFSVKWKEYVPETGAPVYDWAVYQRWWLASITEEGNLRWGDFDENDQVQLGWEFPCVCPIELSYSWYK